MDNITKKNLARLAKHLGLGGFSKIAEEIEEVIEDSELTLEKESDSIEDSGEDILMAEVAMTVYNEIESMLNSNDLDFEEVISELEYVDISSSEYTALEEMILSEFDSLEVEGEQEELEDMMTNLLSKYSFIDHLEDESFPELGEEIQEDLKVLK